MITVPQTIKDFAADMAATFSAYQDACEDYDDMYLMRYGTPSRDGSATVITSPDPRNRLEGGVRLLTMTEPVINIRQYDDMRREMVNLDTLEGPVRRAWAQSGRAGGTMLERDLVRSMLLYGQMHAVVEQTADILDRVKEIGKRAGKDDRSAAALLHMAKRLYARTPWRFSVWSPSIACWERDPFGLSRYHRATNVTAAFLQSRWGDALPEGVKRAKLNASYEVHEYYDRTCYAVWLTSGGDIWYEELDSPILPVVVQVSDGSDLWTSPDVNIQPLLYGAAKSKVWDFQNAALTGTYSIAKNIALTAFLKHYVKGGSKAVDLDFSQTPSVINLDPDLAEDVVPMLQKGILDPAVSQLLGMSKEMLEESTLYSQALGAPPARSGTTFSELSLLAQAGRLPLAATQKLGAWGIAEMVDTALSIFKINGKRYDQNGITLDPGAVPEVLEVDVMLDVHLPQDRLQLANLATMLKKAGIVDTAWIQSELFNITDPGKMREAVWADQVSEAMIMQYVQQRMAEAQRQVQTREAADNQRLMERTGVQPGAQERPQGARPTPTGEPMQGGTPQAQAGMMPGVGEGMGAEPESEGEWPM